MKLATTTGDFGRFCSTYEECVENVCEAGFKYIDLSMYTPAEDDRLLIRDDWRDCTESIRKVADKYGAKFVQAHSPGKGNPIYKDEYYDNLLKMTKRSIEVCGELGIKNTVVHAGTLDGVSKDEFFERNREFFRLLIPEMEKCSVNVLCENSTDANMRGKYFTNSGKDMVEFVKCLDHPLFHACWDTGHANVEGSQYDEIMTLGDELYAVHINDNRGKADEHIIPYLGTLNMDEIMNALIDSGYKGYFTFECDDSLIKPKNWIASRHVFEKDTRLLHPQLFMQKHIEKLLYEIGEYALKSYNCFEE